MDSLNVVNLIQVATVAVSVLGSLLIWRKGAFCSIALLLGLIALAAIVNLLEETGITRDIYLISPIFILLFGPAGYLAAKHLTNKKLDRFDWVHLIPAAPLFMFTSNVSVVIAIGTIWRIVYAYFTAILLINYKRALDEERSDSDEYNFNWLVWIVVIMSVFNLLDLVRLNSQPYIPYELNVLGQGINNSVWLFVVMFITIKFSEQKTLPNSIRLKNEQTFNEPQEENYQSTFDELNRLIISNQLFLQPRLTLSNVSEFTGLQVRDISRAINTISNKSFNEYVNEFRINYVCKALDAGYDHSLTRLYTDAGFSSKASFNKVFKNHTNMTPSEYKSKHKV